MEQAFAIATALCAAFWAGSVFAISFLEAWLKFRAPGVTTTIGLNIGRLVFKALNRLEWALTLTIVSVSLLSGADQTALSSFHFPGAVLLLLLQTGWLLPVLDKRAVKRINGVKTVSSPLHFVFILFEIIKLVLVLLVSVRSMHLL
jgi:hypothetical protein